MAAASNALSVSLKLFNDAIIADDIEAGKSLILANAKILDHSAVCSENFLILAWKLRRFRFIAEIGRIKPVLACEKIQESVEELTSQKQTVFHLAAENYHPDAFAILLEGAKKLSKEHLLDGEDCHGNTVLHIAVPNKQLRIVKMCLPDLSSTTGHGFTIWVNAKNMKGETALDLYYKISDPDFETQHIGSILQEASRREEVSLLSRDGYKKGSNTTSWKTLETKNVLLVVLAIFIGLAFTVGTPILTSTTTSNN
ncbi:hypothetical protein ACOSQ4_027354 [Xanthoceras sorbifolium]